MDINTKSGQKPQYFMGITQDLLSPVDLRAGKKNKMGCLSQVDNQFFLLRVQGSWGKWEVSIIRVHSGYI